MAETVHEFSISIDRELGYVFRTRFDKRTTPSWVMDDRRASARTSADPSRASAAAVGNCLAASLLFCATAKAWRLARFTPIQGPDRGNETNGCASPASRSGSARSWTPPPAKKRKNAWTCSRTSARHSQHPPGNPSRGSRSTG